jgi:GAF domain-containing protein
VDEFDISRFVATFVARTCELFGASAEVGLALADESGQLATQGVSSPRPEIREVFELHHREGPAADAFRTGAALLHEHLDGEGARWPTFVLRAEPLGFRVAHAVPMRVRSETVGVASVLQTDDGVMADAELQLFVLLVDAATIALLQQRRLSQAFELTQQLQEALESRVVIEQAKGIIAARIEGDMQTAFELLRRYARRGNQTLAKVAGDVVAGLVSASILQEQDRGKP